MNFIVFGILKHLWMKTAYCSSFINLKKKNRLLIKLMEGKQPLEPKCIQWVCDKYVTVLQFDN